MRIIRKCGTLRICNLRIHYFLWFADLKLLQIRKYILFLLKKIAYNALIQICTYNIKSLRGLLYLFFIQNCAVFSINLCIFDLRIKHKSLRICDLRTGIQKKLADLRFVNLLKKSLLVYFWKRITTFCNNQNIRSVNSQK